MPLAERNDPYLGARFFVEIDGVDQGGFTECTGLQAEVEVNRLQEGGNNGFVHKLAGRTKYTNVVLKHGMTDSSDLWDWFEDVTQGQIERKDVSVVLYDDERTRSAPLEPARSFSIKVGWPGLQCRPSKPSPSRRCELAHHGFEVE